MVPPQQKHSLQKFLAPDQNKPRFIILNLVYLCFCVCDARKISILCTQAPYQNRKYSKYSSTKTVAAKNISKNEPDLKIKK